MDEFKIKLIEVDIEEVKIMYNFYLSLFYAPLVMLSIMAPLYISGIAPLPHESVSGAMTLILFIVVVVLFHFIGRKTIIFKNEIHKLLEEKRKIISNTG